MTSPQNNQLLATLPPSDLAALNEHFRRVELPVGEVLARRGDELSIIYFPTSGIVSFIVDMEDGHVIQTSMVGLDGVIGASQALDDRTSLNKIIVQTAVSAFAIDRGRLRQAAQQRPAVREVLAAYEQFFVADIQQTAVLQRLA